MLNLSVLLENSARRYPTRDAYIFMDTHLTFAQVNGAANQIANGLKKSGIRPGDKVALSCLNLPYFPMIYFGILKSGATVVPLSVLLKRDEIAYHLQDSDAKAYFCFVGAPELPMLQEGHAGFQEASECKDLYVITPQPTDPSPVEGLKTLGMLMGGQPPTFESEQTSAEDVAVIVYTSGTTGRPKGAQLTHSNMLQNAIISKDLNAVTTEDRQIIVLPLFHIFAMTCQMNNALYTGCTSILLPRFTAPDVFRLIVKHDITLFVGVPTMFWALLNDDSGTVEPSEISSRLRRCLSGGASLPVAVLEGFEAKFDVPVLEGFGMSEGSPVVTFNQIDIGRKPGSVGTPVWGVEAKVVDADGNEVARGEKGEMVFRGHNVMKGYYQRPEENERAIRNGWLHSGDVAIQDEDGFFFIVDRTKDMIIRGGLNVYPREVEDVMMQHPAVSMVAVIGVPDDRNGEEIKACVVCKDGNAVTAEELMEYTKANIASYKYPRHIEFMDTLPMSATGKILKKELRKL
ncbi:MAG: long-chain fatty acid--CoA ligase [Saprospiraceae bacterium]